MYWYVYVSTLGHLHAGNVIVEGRDCKWVFQWMN